MAKAKYVYDVTHNDVSKVYDYTSMYEQYPKVLKIMDTNDLHELTMDGHIETISVQKREVDDNVCFTCDKNTLVQVCSKSSDLNNFQHRHREYDGYVLKGMGIGEGDYIELTFCTNCGQIQDNFPKTIHGALITRDTDGYVKGGA